MSKSINILKWDVPDSWLALFKIQIKYTFDDQDDLFKTYLAIAAENIAINYLDLDIKKLTQDNISELMKNPKYKMSCLHYTTDLYENPDVLRTNDFGSVVDKTMIYRILGNLVQYQGIFGNGNSPTINFEPTPPLTIDWGNILGEISKQLDLIALLNNYVMLSTFNNLSSQVSQIATDILALQNLTQKHTSEILALQNLTTTQTTEIGNVKILVEKNKSDIATNTTNIEKNKVNIATNTTDIATNKSNITNNITKIASIENDLGGVEQIVGENTQLINTNKTKISTLENDLGDLGNIVNENTQAIDINKTNIGTNTTNITTNTTDITNIKNNYLTTNTDQTITRKKTIHYNNNFLDYKIDGTNNWGGFRIMQGNSEAFLFGKAGGGNHGIIKASLGNLLLESNGIITVNNKRLTGIATPTENSDASTKQYVDTSITSSQTNVVTTNTDQTIDANKSFGTNKTLNLYVHKNGGNGIPLKIHTGGGKFAGMWIGEGATQQGFFGRMYDASYVMGIIADQGNVELRSSGNIDLKPTNVINCFEKGIANLKDPSSPGDGANKRYVDKRSWNKKGYAGEIKLFSLHSERLAFVTDNNLNSSQYEWLADVTFGSVVLKSMRFKIDVE